MTLTTHSLVTETFVPMLESLAGIIEKGEAHAATTGQDLINARLAPDMFHFAKQIDAVCFFARNTASRLSGGPALAPGGEPKTSWAELKAQVTDALAAVRAAPVAGFEGADERDCAMELPGGMQLPLNGEQFLVRFALPNFYFHLACAYAILRNHGVELGKRDYLAGIASLMQPKPD